MTPLEAERSVLNLAVGVKDLKGYSIEGMKAPTIISVNQNCLAPDLLKNFIFLYNPIYE